MTRTAVAGGKDIAVDLAWVDMLKGIAIIGVFFDNWDAHMAFEITPGLLETLFNVFAFAAGPFVQVFFILSGFGLTLAFFEGKSNWSWKRWMWRRVTKIVVPYVIAVFLTFVLGALGSYLYSSIDMRFFWTSLLAHFVFIRNFYPPSWDWNYPLWFMHVIVGLYISFPVLIKILEKWGLWALLLISVSVTYGTTTIATLMDLTTGHTTDWFSFWMAQFALGMALAFIKRSHPHRLRHMIGWKAFFVGIGFYLFSLGIRTYVPFGRSYNDLFTSIGIWLILLNVGWFIQSRVPVVESVLKSLSAHAYLMYLVHYPIMVFLIKPLLRAPMNAVIVVALGSAYMLGIYFLCRFASRPVEKLTSWLYGLFFSPYQRPAW
jgi:peptidoglycan/LPS O-acetylase OafA/YrhL